MNRYNMEWYKTLNINQRINLKDNCQLIVGLDFLTLRVLFSTVEIINILYDKLKQMGFNI